MSDAVEFETPENVTVQYKLAGTGTRFVAWVFDMLIIFVACLLIVIVFGLFGTLLQSLPGNAEDPFVIFVVIALLGFSVLAYFLVFEFVMHGQTPGKRRERIRVVSASGFSLTFGALFIRNMFRVLDTTPLLWVVPLVSERGQRLGDMVAGTIIIQEQEFNPDSAQGRLLSRSDYTARFIFSQTQIGQLTENDIIVTEMFLERNAGMEMGQAARMRKKLIATMTERLGVPLEDHDEHAEQQYLEDMLTAHLRNQVRELE